MSIDIQGRYNCDVRENVLTATSTSNTDRWQRSAPPLAVGVQFLLHIFRYSFMMLGTPCEWTTAISLMSAFKCAVRQLLLSLLMLCYFNQGDAQCPTAFSMTGGHCIYRSTEKRSYCEAQDFCYSREGELVTGDKISSLSVSTDSWVGLTDMLDETTRQDRFRFTNGSFAPNLFNG